MAHSRSPANTTKRSKQGLAAALGTALFFAATSVAAQPRAATSLEHTLTIQVCRSGPAAGTTKAARANGDAEPGAIEPIRLPSLVLEHQQTLEGPRERESIAAIAIPLALGGRRGSLKDAAVARRGASHARADADAFETALQFRRAYASTSLEAARLGVLQRQQQALESLTKKLEQLAARGERSNYDVRRQQMESTLHARTVSESELKLTRARAELAIWLGRPLDDASLADQGSWLSPITHAAVSEHPELAALRADARASAAESEAARKRWVPELEAFVGYRQIADEVRTGHGVSLGLTVPLTFFEHGAGAATKAHAEQALFEARVAREKRQQSIEASAAIAHTKALAVVLAQSERTLAATRGLTEGALQLYNAGEASIADVLDAYRTAENAELARIEVLEDLMMTRLQAMRAAGTQFDRNLDAACLGQGAGR
jgi:cobalt-zinc-cadmium efflux system outer membrane protein